MKNFVTIVLSALTATLVTLLFQKVNQPTARKSRKIEDIAPTYNTLTTEFIDDNRVYEVHNEAWIKFVREAVQSNLSELEADEIAQAILDFHPPAYNYQRYIMPIPLINKDNK